MFPVEFNGNDTRLSILKPCKPQQSLDQNVNLNSSSNENSPLTSKIKRRVSFAEKKHVKEFCHSTEQGTVWDNTYEEHDSKGSSSIDQTATTCESKEYTPECISENSCTHITVKTSKDYRNEFNTEDNRLYNSTTMGVNNDNIDCNLSFTNPVGHLILSDAGSPVEQTELLNASRNTASNVFTIYRDTDEIYESVSNNKCHTTCTDNVNETCFLNQSMELTTDFPISLDFLHLDKKEHEQNYVQTDKTCFLNQSMELTTPVPITLHLDMKENTQNNVLQNNFYTNCIDYLDVPDIKFSSLQKQISVQECKNAIHDAAASDNFGKIVSAPLHRERESAGSSVLETNPIANDMNKTIHHNISMEITTAVSSILQRAQGITTDRTENLNVSKNNSSQHVMENDIIESACLVEFEKSMTKDSAISKEIVDTADIQNKSLDTCTISMNNANHSSNIILKGVSDEKGTSPLRNIELKELSSSFTENQTSNENNVNLSSRKDLSINKFDKLDESLAVEMVHTCISTQMSKSDAGDSLSKIDDLLRKSLVDSQHELQSINAPSFMEENSSFLNVLCDNAASIDNKNGNFSRLESTNNECNQAENCQRDIVATKIDDDREFDRRVSIVMNYDRIDESNLSVRNVEHLNEDVSLKDIGKREQIILGTNFKEIEIMNEDCVDANKYIEEGIEDESKVQDIEENERYSDAEEKLKSRENLNNKTNLQNIELEVYMNMREDHLDAEQYISSIIAEGSLIQQDQFFLLSQKLEIYADGNDCIWNVYHKNIDKKMIVFGFMSNSLLIAVFLRNDLNCPRENTIKRIKIISRLADDADELMKIVHGLILDKINVEVLEQLYTAHNDFFPMLDFVTQEVKLAMDFMFDLKRLNDVNLMGISRNEISFSVWSKSMKIILEITINVKRFDMLTPNDVNIRYKMGENLLRETDMKSLFKGVKKDYTFLRRYIDDIKLYIDIMEETCQLSNNQE